MRFKQRGASAVEFALMLPLLLLVIDGVMELSLVLYDKLILSNAASVAVRRGVVIQTPKLTSAEIAAVAQSYCQAYVLSFGAPRSVVVSVTQEADPVHQSPLTVTLSYTYQSLLLGGFFSAIQSPIVLTSSAMLWHE
jgi:Flp pilus assembly protein TadG